MAAQREGSRLSREFGLPLYHQIQHLIRHRITKGEYTPASQIPSENELCRELKVSRVTLRVALRELVRDRWPSLIVLTLHRRSVRK